MEFRIVTILTATGLPFSPGCIERPTRSTQTIVGFFVVVLIQFATVMLLSGIPFPEDPSFLVPILQFYTFSLVLYGFRKFFMYLGLGNAEKTATLLLSK